MNPILRPLLFPGIDPDYRLFMNKVERVGSLSQPTERAAGVLFNDWKVAGIFPNLQLEQWFIGDDLNTATVPFVGPTSVFNGIVAADFLESNGLTLLLSSKYVDCVFIPGNTVGGLSVSILDDIPASANGIFFAGSQDSGGTNQAFGIKGNRNATNTNSSGQVNGVWGGPASSRAIATVAGQPGGFGLQKGTWSVVRRAMNLLAINYEGTDVQTGTVATAVANSGQRLFLGALNNGGTATFSAVTQATRFTGVHVDNAGFSLQQQADYLAAKLKFDRAIGRA